MKFHSQTNAGAVLMGTNGSVIITDTGNYTGNFFALFAIEDTVVSGATFDSSLVSGSLDGKTLPKGSYFSIYGLESIQLSSGSVIAYNQ